MEIKLIEINQYWKKSYLWKLSFDELDKLAKLTLRNDDWKDELFQRQEESWKVNKILEYMSVEKETPVFSTPIVLWINIEEYNENAEDNKIEFSDSILKIHDNISKVALIVDWQHRYRWMDKYFKQFPEKKENFEIPVVFLLNYDNYELWEIFININFTAKPVNKSLFYDIFWSLPWWITEIKIAHLLVKNMQEDQESPLFWTIKVLWKWSWLFSQAFAVEKIVSLLKKNSVWFKSYLNIKNRFENYENNNNIDLDIKKTEEYIKIKDFLFNYFSIIKKLFADYSYEITSDNKIVQKWILFKTTWMWALFRLIEDFFINWKENEIESLLSKTIWDSEILFWPVWKYWKSWSEWNQVKLYKELATKIFNNSQKEIVRKWIITFNIWEEFEYRKIYNKVIKDLQEKYPDNKFLEAKILQLLQILRDEWFLEFVWKWVYKLLKKD